MEVFMESNKRARVEARMAQLEEMWAHLDELCAGFGPDDWARRHGPDWTFADVPYHMYYFDQEFIAEAIEKGPNVPDDQRVAMRTMGDVSAWNASWFARRPSDQTPEQSLAQMRASREAIRRAVARLSDADLGRPVWFSLVSTRGWRTVEFALWVCLIHTWMEFMELRLHAQRDMPVPSPEITHIAVDGYTRLLRIFLNQEQAAKTALTAVREITGPGGGAWTIRVADGACTITEGRPAEADLVVSQSPEAYVKAPLPIVVMKNREGQVSNWELLAIFSQLFPPPPPEKVIEPLP
jgi:DinB family protein